jgi:hypothetical protein
MELEDKRYPVFIAVYPQFYSQQLAVDIEECRRATGKERALFFCISPTEEADKLEARFREDYSTLNVGVCLWKLDLEKTERGWEWKRGETVWLKQL